MLVSWCSTQIDCKSCFPNGTVWYFFPYFSYIFQVSNFSILLGILAGSFFLSGSHPFGNRPRLRPKEAWLALCAAWVRWRDVDVVDDDDDGFYIFISVILLSSFFLSLFFVLVLLLVLVFCSCSCCCHCQWWSWLAWWGVSTIWLQLSSYASQFSRWFWIAYVQINLYIPDLGVYTYNTCICK